MVSCLLSEGRTEDFRFLKLKSVSDQLEMGKNTDRLQVFAEENPCCCRIAAPVCFVLAFVLLVVGSIYVARNQDAIYHDNYYWYSYGSKE